MTATDQALPPVQQAFDRARLANHDSFYAVRLPKSDQAEQYHSQLSLYLGAMVSPVNDVQSEGTDYIEFRVNKSGLSSSNHPYAEELKSFVESAVEGISKSYGRPFTWTPPISIIG